MLNHAGIQNGPGENNPYNRKFRNCVDSEHFHVFSQSVSHSEKLSAGLVGDVE